MKSVVDGPTKTGPLSPFVYFIDCGDAKGFKIKKELSEFIEKYGGTVSMILNNKVQYYIYNGDFSLLVDLDKNEIYSTTKKKDILLDNLSFNIKKALKLNIPVLSKRFLEDSILNGSLLSSDEYSLVSQYNIKENHYNSYDFSDILNNEDGGKDQQQLQKQQYQRKKYDPLVKDDFPEDSYHIVKYNLMVVSGNDFICIELHAAGDCLKLIQTGQQGDDVASSSSSSGTGGQSKFRVFLHYGQSNKMEESVKEWIVASDINHALSIYNSIFLEYSAKNYFKISLTSVIIGSDKLKQSSTVERVGSSTLHVEVDRLVYTIYADATTSLGTKLGSSSLTLSPEGSIKTSFGDIALNQVEKAELILFQLSNELRSLYLTNIKSTTTSSESSSSVSVSDTPIIKESIKKLYDDLYNALPQLKKIKKEYTVQCLSDIQEIIQLMKDVLSFGESLGASSRPNTTETRYKSLKCNIDVLDKSSKEFKQVLNQFDLNVSIV